MEKDPTKSDAKPEPSPRGVVEISAPQGRGSSDRAALEKMLKEGIRLQREGDLEAAISLYHQIVAQAPEAPAVYHNLGTAYRKQGKYAAAVACYRRALEAAPDSPAVLGSLGNALKDLERFEESIAAHRTAVGADPQNAMVHHNLGIALKASGDLERALEAFDAAARLAPEDSNIEWDRALLLLQLGNFSAGWKAYEARWHLDEVKPRRFERPRWDGRPFKNQTLLIHPEQGFGDAILISRFLPQVKALGGTVVLECKPELRRVFSDLAGVDRFLEYGKADSGFDFHCPLMSLPGQLGFTADTYPPPAQLHIPPDSRKRLGPIMARAGDRFKVGVIWSGSLTFKGNSWRSTAIEHFLNLADVPGIQLYSLQKGPLERNLITSGAFPVMIGIGGQMRDFADTAAAVEALDLVIMTDTSVAHLAGTLGKPVWNLLSFVPYWLYGMKGESTPWYPSMRLFRQTRPGDWDSLFDQVAEALTDAVQAKNNGRWPSRTQGHQ